MEGWQKKISGNIKSSMNSADKRTDGRRPTASLTRRRASRPRGLLAGLMAGPGLARTPSLSCLVPTHCLSGPKRREGTQPGGAVTTRNEEGLPRAPVSPRVLNFAFY